MSTAYEYLSQPSSQEELHLIHPLAARPEIALGAEATPQDGSKFSTLSESIDHDGVAIRHVSFFDISDDSPSKYEIRDRITGYVERVRLHPEWQAPRVNIDERGNRELVCNPVAEEMYAEMPAMASWRKELVPGAVALYPLQYPGERCLPNGVEIDDLTRDMFTNSLDAIGIRTRAKVMSHLAANYINEGGATSWTSLACGAAVPVLNAIEDNIDKVNGINLKLIDLDPSALSFAGDLAESRGLAEGEDFELLNRNLLREMIATDRLVQEIGEESMDLVDALGIFEYFNEKYSEKFLANSYKLVKPGGALVAANMLDAHPEIHFNQRVIGWPTIYPRSVEGLKAIIERAGIDLNRVSVTIPSDGIYAIFEIKK